MRILIVGAGSIGQLYGFILQRGGAEVDVYVRPRYVDEAERGYRIYERRKGLDAPEIFEPAAILTSPDEVADEEYDAIILCISATALRGPWLREFTEVIGDATLISLTPGLDDRDYIAQYVDEEQLAMGAITAVSYPAPLPGEEASEPGTAFWLPPLTPALFDGPDDRLRPILKVLKNGGMRSRAMKNLPQTAAMTSAILMSMIGVLEMVGWSISELRASREHRELLDDASDEALSIVEYRFDAKRPLPSRLLGPFTWSGLLLAAPIAPPFDLETYLEVHFTKTADQTRMIIEDYISRREKADLPSPALERVLDEIGDDPT